jgi:excisionase family DNA binding protein
MSSPTPLYLSVTEASKFLGVSTRTIRRAISADAVTYIVVKDRYKITLDSLLLWATTTATVGKKLHTEGFGAYVEKWNIPQKKRRDPKSSA